MTFDELDDAVKKFRVRKQDELHRREKSQLEMPRCQKCGNQVLLHNSGNGLTMCDTVFGQLLERAEVAAENIGCLVNVPTHFHGMAVYRAPCP